MERRFVGREEQEVIHIAQVPFAAQDALDELVQRIQVDIGPELRGLVANRQATRAAQGAVCPIAGKDGQEYTA